MIRVQVRLSPRSEQLLRDYPARAALAVDNTGRAIDQGAREIEAWMQTHLMTGGDWHKHRGGEPPLAVRSGLLRRSTYARMTGRTSAVVGAGQGASARYANAVLGEQITTITPKQARHLWIPIADNLNAGGTMRISPREAMAMRTPTGKRLLRIFKSRAGNLVAFLPEARQASSTRDRSEVWAATGARFKSGKKKALGKGRLLFTLKKSVTVEGIRAISRAVAEKKTRVVSLVRRGLARALRERSYTP